MNLRGLLFLGVSYLNRHRSKTLLLVSAITLILTLPPAVSLTVRQAETQLRERARVTPLLLGAAGSPLELTFNALYFSNPSQPVMPIKDAKAAAADLARCIPLDARFRARNHPVVGIDFDYFGFRHLKLREGRWPAILGECVLGARAAQQMKLQTGGTLVTTPQQMLNLAGIYPIKLHVTGVLAPSGSSDDGAVFVDLKTVWAIQGIAHGHADARPTDKTVLSIQDQNLALNASVREYTEITPANLASFHFHGDPADFPITAAILLPRDDKAETILLGRFAPGAARQLIRPATVLAELFATVFQVRDIAVAILSAVAAASLVIAFLVFLLSHRLRQAEFSTLAHLGTSRAALLVLTSFETAAVLLASLVLAGGLLALLNAALPGMLRALLE